MQHNQTLAVDIDSFAVALVRCRLLGILCLSAGLARESHGVVLIPRTRRRRVLCCGQAGALGMVSGAGRRPEVSSARARVLHRSVFHLPIVANCMLVFLGDTWVAALVVRSMVRKWRTSAWGNQMCRRCHQVGSQPNHESTGDRLWSQVATKWVPSAVRRNRETDASFEPFAVGRNQSLLEKVHLPFVAQKSAAGLTSRATSFMAHSAEQAVLEECFQKNRRAGIDKAWLSSFFREGLLIKRVDGQQWFMPLGVVGLKSSMATPARLHHTETGAEVKFELPLRAQSLI